METNYFDIINCDMIIHSLILLIYERMMYYNLIY